MAGRQVVDLAAGQAANLIVAGHQALTVIPGSGATVTVSKVDDEEATSHDTDTSQDVTNETQFAVNWPIYRVSTAGGSARVGLVA